MSKPSRASSALNRRVLAQSRSMSSGSSCMTRIASRHAAATAGGWEVEKRNGRARWIEDVAQRLRARDVAAEHADGLRSVPTWIATRPWSPKWSTEPRPFRPRTPDAWASSTKTAAPNSSAASTMPGSGAMSPSIENTPSVTTRISRYGPPRRRGPFSRASRRTSRSAVDVRVRVDLARRLRQAHPVDDRGVVERVRDDQVRSRR